jgi:hypothetical protein
MCKILMSGYGVGSIISESIFGVYFVNHLICPQLCLMSEHITTEKFRCEKTFSHLKVGNFVNRNSVFNMVMKCGGIVQNYEKFVISISIFLLSLPNLPQQKVVTLLSMTID